MKGGKPQSGAGKANLELHESTLLSPQLYISCSVLSQSNQPFSQSTRDSTTANQSLTMSIATPSLNIILHDGKTGEASNLTVDCSAFELKLRDSTETHLLKDDNGTLLIKHCNDNDCLASFTRTVGPKSWLEVSIGGQKSRIVVPGGHTDFEQTADSLSFVESKPGDVDTDIGFNAEQKEKYEKQKDEYDRQVKETTQLMEAYTKRMVSAGQESA